MITDQPIDVLVQRSGIASIVSVASRAEAQRLNDYLASQGCSVGDIFEAASFSFFAYSIKHPVRETIAQNAGYRLVDRRVT